MAREIVTLAWDDIHRVEDDTQVPGPHERSFSMGGYTYVLDLSAEHAFVFDETMQRLMGCAHDKFKTNQPREGRTPANAIMDEHGDIVMLDDKTMQQNKANARAITNAVANHRIQRTKTDTHAPQGVAGGDTARALAIRDPERRKQVRAWGMKNGKAKYRGILSVDCQQAFVKEFGLADINDPINDQKALEAIGA